MHKSKLISLIQNLSTKELHWLQKFLNSPFYNSNQESLRLFKYLKKYYPKLDSPKLDKSIVSQKLYPGEKLNLQKIRKAMHELAILVEDFLVAFYLKNQTFEKEKILSKALGKRDNYENFKKVNRKSIAELEEKPYRDSRHHLDAHQLEFEYFHHLETNKQKENKPVLKKAMEHLDAFYLLKRQELELALQWQLTLFGGKASFPSLADTKKSLTQEPLFKLYQRIQEAMNSDWQGEQYQLIEDLFKKEIQKISLHDQKEIYRMLLNHLSGQINQGRGTYYTKMLDLYQFGLRHGLTLENGKMSETTFMNIATVGILENAYDWVENFLKEYRPFLPASSQEEAYRLSLGLLFFYKKDYPDTIALLINYSFTPTLYILKSKALLLRTYFEQFMLDDSYYDLLIAQTYAFEKFVRRNETIAPNKQTAYLNFILSTRNLAQSILQKNIDPRFLKKIQSHPTLILKSWLLQKTKDALKK